MYKDKEKQKEAVRKAVERRRVLQKGITKQGITPEGITSEERIEFIQKELNDPFLIKRIEVGARIFSDREARYERAYRYKVWKDNYIPKVIHS